MLPGVIMEGTRKRKGNITAEQKRKLSQMVAANEGLKSNKFSSNFTVRDAQEAWEEIAAQLNSIPGGAIKDWRAWRKSWQDWKSSVKRKVVGGNNIRYRARANLNNTVTGVNEQNVKLKEYYDEKLKLMRRTKEYYEGKLKHMRHTEEYHNEKLKFMRLTKEYYDEKLRLMRRTVVAREKIAEYLSEIASNLNNKENIHQSTSERKREAELSYDEILPYFRN